MKMFGYSSLPVTVLAIIAFVSSIDRPAAQEISLTPLQASEVARGYRAEALKVKPVVNGNNEPIGRISDFVISKEGNSTYVILGVGDFTGLSGQSVAIPFTSFKLDDRSGYIVLPGASRSALEKLPVFLTNR